MAGKMGGGGEVAYVVDGRERGTTIVIALVLGAWLGFCVGFALGRAEGEGRAADEVRAENPGDGS